MSDTKRPHRWPWIVGILILAISGIGAKYALQGNEGATTTAEEKNVATPGVMCLGYVDVEPGVAHLHPVQPGLVAWVIKEGSPVEKDEVILKLDRSLAQSKLDEAKAALDEATKKQNQAELLPAQKTLKEKQQSTAIEEATIAWRKAKTAHDFQVENKAGKITLNAYQEEVDRAKVAIDREKLKLEELDLMQPDLEIARAKADVAAKQAQVKAAEWALSQTELKAPEKGMVLRVNVQTGEVLGTSAQASAVEFVADRPRVVRAEVLQEWASRVAIGDKVMIQDDTFSGKSYEGKVTRIAEFFSRKRSPVIEPFMMNDVRTLECIVEITSSDHSFRIGQRVRARIVVKEANKTGA